MAGIDVALVTFAGQPTGWDDDHILAGALQRRGAAVEFVCWDDPSVQWGSVGVAAIRSTWDYHRRLDAFLSWAAYAASVTALVNEAETITWNAHKRYLLDIAAAGVPVVPTRMVSRGGRVELGAGQWVVKPAVSIGAERTVRNATQRDVDELLETDDVLVQPYVAEVEEGEISIICIGGEPMHAVRKVPVPGDFRTQEHHGAAVHRMSISHAHEELVDAALATAPHPPAYARVDLVDTAAGPLLMELELIEPTLWLEKGPESADALADLLLKRP